MSEQKRAIAAALLVRPDVNPNLADATHGGALHTAVREGRADVVEVLLKKRKDADVNLAGGPNGETALLQACRACQVDMIEKLVKHKDIDVNRCVRSTL